MSQVRPHRQATPHVSPQDDGYEGTLKVPNSVLDGCEKSFTAADESRQKASTKFFDSTALMGMLCRHDRVLWLVNMTSPGERQHYVFVLIDTLFQHLPLDFKVGILYDVACSTHRSCIKWGFLSKYLGRLTFAISVFHAYGHGWPCQCVYHPRKCPGFGLSDGEGCERFWHMISKLVAYLRICGVSTETTQNLHFAYTNNYMCSITCVFIHWIIKYSMGIETVKRGLGNGWLGGGSMH